MEWIFQTGGRVMAMTYYAITVHLIQLSIHQVKQRGMAAWLSNNASEKTVEESDRALIDVLFTHQFGQTVKIRARF